ncbi:SDR family NAD(P)-dependent oxidoreductase [Glaciibacter psychrotolerans]|uniref:NAD(P)-dependent dehydrogenase (Short-subunit alcohol dehydrogenase family) n=1 Tax=Glaciibacter psychrotolerans TaxID=670054 RepID=A0A7Z0EBE2_9MICO|nr:SDR family oxidoreductase [Leifsonia psychrotolerans]NYJ18552.1 NAD(P)-dependent dehydrogenase (short-subunit alcohol dehydrogenase family) [Leifsonia psychrotolerans]
MDMQLANKRAFISGSTQGIGYSIAKALLREGVAVVINGRDNSRLQQSVKNLEAEVPGGSVTGIAADFADAAEVQRLLGVLGGVDILVNNVGLFELKPFTDIPDDDWSRYFDVNVMSGVRLSRALLPGMIDAGWGRIIFIGSESGVAVPADMTHYGVTKAGMLALSNGLAKLTRATGVTVNTILGGPTYSDGVAGTIRDIAEAQQLSTDELKAMIIGGNQTSLLERFIEPDEIANLAVYLASPLSSATNGAAVRADGGVLTAVL